jgi:hypothetical protein
MLPMLAVDIHRITKVSLSGVHLALGHLFPNSCSMTEGPSSPLQSIVLPSNYALDQMAAKTLFCKHASSQKSQGFYWLHFMPPVAF